MLSLLKMQSTEKARARLNVSRCSSTFGLEKIVRASAINAMAAWNLEE